MSRTYRANARKNLSREMKRVRFIIRDEERARKQYNKYEALRAIEEALAEKA